VELVVSCERCDITKKKKMAKRGGIGTANISPLPWLANKEQSVGWDSFLNTAMALL
jgi:hypothetical protein